MDFLRWIGKHWWRILLLFVSTITIGLLLFSGLNCYDSQDRAYNFLAIVILTPITLYICCWRSLKLVLISIGVLIISYGVFIGIEFHDIYGCQTRYLDKVKREFYWLTSDFTIPDYATLIGDHAFEGCSSLTNISIPNGVTSIGDYAFIRCWNLKSVTIPNSVTSIGEYAFWGCRNLTNMYCKATRPPIVEMGIDYYGYTIYVPRASVNTYTTADKWKKFEYKIVGYNFE